MPRLIGVLAGHILYSNAHERAPDRESYDLVQVINAYMSLLALRSESRWEKLKKDEQNLDQTKAEGQTERCEEAQSQVDENDEGPDVMQGKSSEDSRADQMDDRPEMEQETRRTRRGALGASGGSDSIRSSVGSDKDVPQEEGSKAGDPGRRSGREEGSKAGGAGRRSGREEPSLNSGDTEGSGGSPKRCAFFSSFFYALLRNAKDGYKYENVRRWSRKKVRSALQDRTSRPTSFLQT